MPKYNVCVNEISYYLTTEIEAQDETEAEVRYMEMVNNGDIEENESEFTEIRVEKIN